MNMTIVATSRRPIGQRHTSRAPLLTRFSWSEVKKNPLACPMFKSKRFKDWPTHRAMVPLCKGVARGSGIFSASVDDFDNIAVGPTYHVVSLSYIKNIILSYETT
jgi:hypothetical protein